MINIYANQYTTCVNTLNDRVAMILINDMTSEWSVMLIDDYIISTSRMNTYVVNHNETLPIQKWNNSINGVFDINLEVGNYSVYHVSSQGYEDANDPAFQAYIQLHIMNIKDEVAIRNQKYYRSTLRYSPCVMVVSNESNQFLTYYDY